MEAFAIYSLVLTLIFGVAIFIGAWKILEVKRTLESAMQKVDDIQDMMVNSMCKFDEQIKRVEETLVNHDRLVENQKLIIENQKTIEKHLSMRKFNPGVGNGTLSNTP